MKRVFIVAALSASLVMAMGGAASPAEIEVEVIVFQVKCILPKFTTPGNFIPSCGGGLADVGVGTVFNGVASPPAAATNVVYNEPNCAQGFAVGLFSIGGAAGTFHYQRVGALAVITFGGIDGAGYTNGFGAALGFFSATTAGDAMKIARACAGTQVTNVGVTITGIASLLHAKLL